MEDENSSVVEVATEQLRKSGKYEEEEVETYAALLQALHEETAMPNPDPNVLSFLGKQIAALTSKVDPYEGLSDLIKSGELRRWIQALDDELPTEEIN